MTHILKLRVGMPLFCKIQNYMMKWLLSYDNVMNNCNEQNQVFCFLNLRTNYLLFL